jgi:hypothetical protein
MEASNVCRNMRIVRPVLAPVFRVPGRRIVMTPEEVTPLFFGNYTLDSHTDLCDILRIK